MNRTKDEVKKMFIKKPTLCWNCAKAGGFCSWSKDFIPVKGWKAEYAPLKLSDYGRKTYSESYCVLECPKFEKG